MKDGSVLEFLDHKVSSLRSLDGLNGHEKICGTSDHDKKTKTQRSSVLTFPPRHSQ